MTSWDNMQGLLKIASWNTGRVTKRDVTQSSEVSDASVNALQHWARCHRGFIQNKQVHFLHFLSNFTIWCNTTATAIIIWDWHFESGVDGPTEYQQYDCNSNPCCNFCLVATCNCPIPYIVKKECFSSSSWASWDEIVICNWRGFFNSSELPERSFSALH